MLIVLFCKPTVFLFSKYFHTIFRIFTNCIDKYWWLSVIPNPQFACHFSFAYRLQSLWGKANPLIIERPWWIERDKDAENLNQLSAQLHSKCDLIFQIFERNYESLDTVIPIYSLKAFFKWKFLPRIITNSVALCSIEKIVRIISKNDIVQNPTLFV